MGLANCLTGAYERRLKSARGANTELATAKKELSEVKEESKHLERIALERGKINYDLIDMLAALLAERDRVAADLVAANAHANGLVAESEAMYEKFKSEVKRLWNFRDEKFYRERIKARAEVAAKCTARLEKVKKHLASRDEQDKALLTMSQVGGTYDYLRVLAGQGMFVLEAVLEKINGKLISTRWTPSISKTVFSR